MTDCTLYGEKGTFFERDFWGGRGDNVHFLKVLSLALSKGYELSMRNDHSFIGTMNVPVMSIFRQTPHSSARVQKASA